MFGVLSTTQYKYLFHFMQSDKSLRLLSWQQIITAGRVGQMKGFEDIASVVVDTAYLDRPFESLQEDQLPNA